ncbi:MAG: hypothetical protein QXO48_03150 [Desulfurococcaceae archaeon]
MNKARTHRIKRFAGRVFWTKRKLICDAKEDKALRQVVEGVIGAVKGFNFVGWLQLF